MVQFGKMWEPGVVLGINKIRPRSYLVKLNKNDKCFVRNIKFVRKFKLNYSKVDNNKFNVLLDSYLGNSKRKKQQFRGITEFDRIMN